jgi:hypothetical protein
MWQEIVGAFVHGLGEGAAEQVAAEQVRQEYLRFLQAFGGVLDEILTPQQSVSCNNWITNNLHKYDL